MQFLPGGRGGTPLCGLYGDVPLDRVYNFALDCPNYKQAIACPKQGNKIEVVVLNRLCILGFFLS